MTTADMVMQNAAADINIIPVFSPETSILRRIYASGYTSSCIASANETYTLREKTHESRYTTYIMKNSASIAVTENSGRPARIDAMRYAARETLTITHNAYRVILNAGIKLNRTSGTARNSKKATIGRPLKISFTFAAAERAAALIRRGIIL